MLNYIISQNALYYQAASLLHYRMRVLLYQEVTLSCVLLHHQAVITQAIITLSIVTRRPVKSGNMTLDCGAPLSRVKRVYSADTRQKHIRIGGHTSVDVYFRNVCGSCICNVLQITCHVCIYVQTHQPVESFIIFRYSNF